MFNNQDDARPVDYDHVLFWYFAKHHIPFQEPLHPANAVFEPTQDLVGAFVASGLNFHNIRSWVEAHHDFDLFYHYYMLENYTRELPAPLDNPYYSQPAPWGKPAWFVHTERKMVLFTKDEEVFLAQPLRFVVDDPINPIERWGTRYFLFKPRADNQQSDFHISFEILNRFDYNVTALHVRVDNTGKPTDIINIYPNFLETTNFLTVPDVQGTSDEQVIVVISDKASNHDEATNASPQPPQLVVERTNAGSSRIFNCTAHFFTE